MRLMKTAATTALSLALALPLLSNAEEQQAASANQAATPNQPSSSNVGQGPNPFSDCGIGAALFPKLRVGAVISNIIWDLGLTALTSATASPETCSGKTVATAQFILDNHDQLIEDTAKGSGTHLATLMNIMQVDTNDRAEARLRLRAEMATHLATEGYLSADRMEKANTYYKAIVSATSAS